MIISPIVFTQGRWLIQNDTSCIEEAPIVQLVNKPGIGYDQLPPSVQHSEVLSGNDIGKLASHANLPTWPECDILKETDNRIQELLEGEASRSAYHQYAREELKKLNVDFALKILLLADKL